MDPRALIFMPALVGAAVFGFVFLLFACNYYLQVLASTGAGAREVEWVAEPIIDNAWKLVYLGWLVGMWFGPAYLIGRATTANAAPWLAFAVPLAVLWLCYPVSQLSSLSATSMWIPLVPDVFARFVQKPGAVLVFYALSAVVLAVFGVGFQWAFATKGEWELLFVGAPIVVVAGLVYARLLGRLAFALRFTTGLFSTRKKKKKKPADRAPAAAENAPTIRQPDDLPPLASPDGELTGYNILMADDEPAKPRKRVRAEAAEPEPPPAADLPEFAPPDRGPARRRSADGIDRGRVWTEEDDQEPTSYGVSEPEVKPTETMPREVVEPSKAEMALLSRDDAPKQPKRVWGPDVLAFLGLPGTISAILIASGMCFVVGVMIRVCRDFNPAAGPG